MVAPSCDTDITEQARSAAAAPQLGARTRLTKYLVDKIVNTTCWVLVAQLSRGRLAIFQQQGEQVFI